MPKVQFKFAKEIMNMSDDHKLEIMKSMEQQLGLPSKHTTMDHDHTRTMWTPDEVPIIAAMEDWLYGNLVGGAAFTLNAVLDLMGLAAWDEPEVLKSFGPDFSDWLEKANDNFRLGDIMKMNQQSRERLWKYVADGGTYHTQELANLHRFITDHTPNYGPLLEAYAVRGVFLGKVKRIADQNSLEMLGLLLAQLPVRLEQVSKQATPLSLRSIGGLMQHIEIPPLTDAEVHAVRYAEQNAARHVTKATDSLKLEIQRQVTDARRNRRDSQALRQTLLDTLGEANRDWRRIALTELTDVMANGYIASLPVGTRVMGQGSANACPHCKRLLIGKVLKVADGPGREGQEDTTIWVGKSNIKKRVAEYTATIPLHPHCRCRWVALADFQDVDKDGNIFILPLEQLLERYKRQGLVHKDYTMDQGAPKPPEEEKP